MALICMTIKTYLLQSKSLLEPLPSSVSKEALNAC